MITVICYFTGILIEKEKLKMRGNLLFVISTLLVIFNLFFFKYYNFFNANISDLLGIWNQKSPLPYLDVMLPLGISFYTFQVLGYLIDVRLENTQAERNLVNFTNYVFFFPKMLAGPIERAQRFLPQSHAEKKINIIDFTAGGKLVIWGFFQKLVIADRIAIYVNSIYLDPLHHSGITLLVGSVLYTFQVYADFSGYTDIARGLARILGYDLMENFKRPLLATSITDFWRKWHISLSSWVNDYIYTPLSLKFRNYGITGVVISLFIAFIVVGLWHGAMGTYVVFGVLQGIILTLEFLTLKKRKKFFKVIPSFIVSISGILFTFIFITLSLVFFRAPSIHQAFGIIEKVLTPNGHFYQGAGSYLIYAAFGIIILLIHDLVAEFRNKDVFLINSKYYLVRVCPYALLVLLLLLIGVFDGGQFIYFKF